MDDNSLEGMKRMTETILVIEDDREISKILNEYLIREGYKVVMAHDGEDGLRRFASIHPHLLLVDLMLPKVDGFEVCRQVRQQSEVPIIVVSARQSDIDKIHSLGLGADDYITKPFSPLELVARVKSHLRRYHRYNGLKEQEKVLSFDGLTINTNRRMVENDGKPLTLTMKEFELLLTLAEAPGQVFSKEQLYNRVWKQDDADDIRTVTVHIKNVRRKLGDGSKHPRFIDTVWGIGYKFIGQKHEDS
ncbi:two-component response regulator [Alkalihalophilus pseudofirmus OF4]|uniref:Two-component response regulator n=1 Tax=Alkalihalophilus pseudofirmus (strain ATCC BAA-2126 / JCM 17055 / OF4) TaxID=398511 RepID=D3FWL9_ALKPO|nr:MULTISPECIES: response regulator transcription factor [Alkalihalophilus]ADC50517.1 two-component response regulator [Alkalihalophilus pseudofirmus OF4]MED1602767.1 response regulator transcription factor [Alkalihalophilus marmarensis]